MEVTVGSLNPLCPGNSTQVVRLGDKCLYLPRANQDQLLIPVWFGLVWFGFATSVTVI